MSFFNNFISHAMSEITTTFGQKVTYSPVNHASYEPIGIFNNSFLIIESNGEVGIETRKPAISFNNSELLYPPEEEDALTINGKEYEVISVQDNEVSETVLILMEY